ncbi:SMP-30/gluconolactonase/LRE family protein [Microbacterium sp. NPDC091662]|uniref:SMP-30/gluconolactonase/LRE family protein n=1 Tax=Microbacterium sp. NPDC091662 TaxID=3364211 RepID=UPI003810FD05
MTPENVTGPVAHHAEGPIWSPGWGGLRWVDGEAGDLLALRPDGVTRQHIDDEYLAFARPRSGGGLVAVGARTLYLADDVDGEVRAVASLGTDPQVRMNDGCCDPRGRLLAGSMAYDAAPDAGTVLRVGADLTVTTVLPQTTVSNGIGFSPDARRAYYVDTLTHRIDVFDVVEGELRGRRAFARLPHEQGLPDGLTVAADGSVWVALWDGSAVHGYDATGALVARIELPVPKVTACTFGDDDLGTLYITTSAQGLGADHGTEAGSVFAVRPGVHGMPVTPFAG